VGRLGRLPALLGAASLTVGVGLALAGTSGTSQGARTQTRIYRAFKASGAPAINVTRTVRGSCWEGSVAIDRDDAWRCMSANFSYDPCFSSAKAKGIVLCPDAAWERTGVEIKLTEPLPPKPGSHVRRRYGEGFANKPKPSTNAMPWAVETTAGLKCSFATGGTWLLQGERANYGCPGDVWLYGNPDRTHQPWTIHAAHLGAHKLHTDAIKIAWF
jgi:hypothetical protein